MHRSWCPSRKIGGDDDAPAEPALLAAVVTTALVASIALAEPLALAAPLALALSRRCAAAAPSVALAHRSPRFPDRSPP